MNKRAMTTYEVINTSMIYRDPSYQRELDLKRVKRIVKDFNPNLVNPIKVSLRDGKYWAFDGQHTMIALKMRNNNQDVDVECKVFYGLTQEDEANLFAAQNGYSREPLTREKLKSRFVAKDIDVVDFVNTLEALGISCDFSRSPSEGKLIAYGCAFGIFQQSRKKPHLFTDTFTIITNAWPKNSPAMRKEIISGTYLFLKTYEGQYLTLTAIQKLSKISPLTIISEGNVSRESGARKYAIQILQAYNKGMKTNRLRDDRLWSAAVR